MTEILQQCEDYISKFYQENIGKDLVFHSLKHIRRTVEAVRLIGSESGLEPEELELLEIAAWFHDAGHAHTYERHERKSAEIAREFLRERGYPETRIEKIVHCIWATELSYKPKDHLEKILRDADIIHLGKKSFFKRNRELRLERERILEKRYTDQEWTRDDIEFFLDHEFQTEYARNEFGPQKQSNLNELQHRLTKLKKPGASGEADMESQLLNKMKKGKSPDRGVETMFRVTSRNHFTLSSIADSKASTLISISALIISIILSVLVRRLEEQPQLIIPTIMILITLMGTIVFAVLATRPNVTKLGITRDDIKERKGNLLFFGNFLNMSVEDYEWGMHELMDDRDYLYNNLIRDIYYLGLVLGKKYRFLRLAYNFFMYGLIISVIAYILAFSMN